jgi:hypothetical protein
MDVADDLLHQPILQQVEVCYRRCHPGWRGITAIPDSCSTFHTWPMGRMQALLRALLGKLPRVKLVVEKLLGEAMLFRCSTLTIVRAALY